MTDKIISLNRSAQGNKPLVKRLDLKALLDNGRELIIEHNHEEYYLRITRNNKLILTK